MHDWADGVREGGECGGEDGGLLDIEQIVVQFYDRLPTLLSAREEKRIRTMCCNLCLPEFKNASLTPSYDGGMAGHAWLIHISSAPGYKNTLETQNFFLNFRL